MRHRTLVTRLVALLTVALLVVPLGRFAIVSAPVHAQEASPPRPSHIHTGDCDELGPVIQPLTSLTVPVGEVLGNSDAVVAEAAFTIIPQTLDELVSSDHALKVHLSKAQIQTYLACGDIGGTVDANGALIVGMKEVDGSGYAGIAYLAPNPGGGTSVSVMIAKVIPTAGAAATPAPAATAAAQAEATAAPETPVLVDVSLTEFLVDMPEELQSGPTRFNITNNGQVTHAFVLEGPGIAKRLANPLAPGESARLNVNLVPGVYTIYCPVGEGAHRAKGMELKVTVV
ncbi:MAG: hypothetical protein U0031_17105 [Thermomicrobiales bacterium]